MRKILTLLVTFVIVFFAQAQTDKKLYSSKSGKLSYKYEIEGKQTVYKLVFDDYGRKQAFELTSDSEGYPRSKSIITPENMFVINYEDKQVIKFPVGSDEEAKELYGGDEGEFDLSEMVSEITGNPSGKKGTATVLGKPCDIYEYTDEDGTKGKYWIYKNYLLKGEFLDANGEHIFMEATDFSIDTDVDSKEFEIPSGFEVTDMSEMMEKMKKMQQQYGVPDE